MPSINPLIVAVIRAAADDAKRQEQWQKMTLAQRMHRVATNHGVVCRICHDDLVSVLEESLDTKTGKEYTEWVEIRSMRQLMEWLGY